MNHDPKPQTVLLTVKDAAAEFKVTQKRLRTALDKGELVCYKQDAGHKTQLLYRTDIASWLNPPPTE